MLQLGKKSERNFLQVAKLTDPTYKMAKLFQTKSSKIFLRHRQVEEYVYHTLLPENDVITWCANLQSMSNRNSKEIGTYEVL
jgi:hypothetical protein